MGRAGACHGLVPACAPRGPACATQGGVVKLEERGSPIDDVGQQGITDKGTVDPDGLRAMPQGAQAG